MMIARRGTIGRTISITFVSSETVHFHSWRCHALDMPTMTEDLTGGPAHTQYELAP